MKERINAKFYDAHQAHRAVREILARGGRDLDITTMFEGAYAVPDSAATASRGLRGAATAALGLLTALAPSMQLARQGSLVKPLSALGSVVAAAVASRLGRSSDSEDPPETYAEGSAELSVACPSGRLSAREVEQICRRYGAQRVA